MGYRVHRLELTEHTCIFALRPGGFAVLDTGCSGDILLLSLQGSRLIRVCFAIVMFV